MQSSAFNQLNALSNRGAQWEILNPGWTLFRSRSDFFFNDPPTPEIYALPLLDALPISLSTPCVTVNLTVTSGLVGSPSALTFNSVNSATPSTQPLTVTTSPSSSVPFTATSNQSWLTVNGAS